MKPAPKPHPTMRQLRDVAARAMAARRFIATAWDDAHPEAHAILAMPVAPGPRPVELTRGITDEVMVILATRKDVAELMVRIGRLQVARDVLTLLPTGMVLVTVTDDEAAIWPANVQSQGCAEVTP